MKAYRINAFFEQYPFLTHGDHALVKHVSEVEEVEIEQFHPSLLERKALYYGATGSLVGVDDSVNVYLLGEDGTVLKTVKQTEDIVHNEAYCDNEYREGETLGEALLHVDPSAVRYVVTIHTGYTIRDHHSVGGYSITVCEVPSTVLLQWIEEQKKKARQELAEATVLMEKDARR